jgi:hypothetical protein
MLISTFDDDYPDFNEDLKSFTFRKDFVCLFFTLNCLVMKILYDSNSRNQPRIIILNKYLLLLVPVLLLGAFSRKVIGFTFPKDKTSFPIIGLVSISVLLVTYLFSLLIGFLGVMISLWLIGTYFIIMLVNSLTPGLIFIKPLCIGCSLKSIIIQHEKLHLSGILKEREVWSIIKKEYDLSRMINSKNMLNCGNCPIPIRVMEH